MMFSTTNRSGPSGVVRVTVAVPVPAAVGVKRKKNTPDRSVIAVFSIVIPPIVSLRVTFVFTG